MQVSPRFIGDRICVSSWKHFNRSAGRSVSCAAADDQKKRPSAHRGVDRKAGRFSSPRLRVLLWSFLPTREESGVPETIERTIKNPANPQICRRSTMQGKRIAAGVSRPRGGGYRKCKSARSKTSSVSRLAGDRRLPPSPEGKARNRIAGNAYRRGMEPPITDRRYDSLPEMRICALHRRQNPCFQLETFH